MDTYITADNSENMQKNIPHVVKNYLSTEYVVFYARIVIHLIHIHTAYMNNYSSFEYLDCFQRR